MTKNNCEFIRRELDELMLDETCNASVAEHLKECSACREFNQTQTKLRRMVGSLGTVAAPADFDFRLRARLASSSSNGVFHYWPVVQRALAVAAVLIVLGFGVVVVRNLVNRPKEQVAKETAPAPQQPQLQPARSVEPAQPRQAEHVIAQAPANNNERIRNERSSATEKKPKRLSTIDSANTQAELISGSEAFSSDATTVFPIDASVQPLRLSLDDGRGNAKTISVPTIRFGQQRMLPGNQLAQKGIW